MVEASGVLSGFAPILWFLKSAEVLAGLLIFWVWL